MSGGESTQCRCRRDGWVCVLQLRVWQRVEHRRGRGGSDGVRTGRHGGRPLRVATGPTDADTTDVQRGRHCVDHNRQPAGYQTTSTLDLARSASVINDTVWHSTPDIGGSVARLHLSSCDHVLSNFSSQARYLHTSPVTVQTVVFYSLNSDEFQSTLHFDSMTYILFTVFNCVSTRLLNKHASCCPLACQTHTLANSDGASQISVFFCRWPFCTTVYISLTVAYDLDTK